MASAQTRGKAAYSRNDRFLPKIAGLTEEFLHRTKAMFDESGKGLQMRIMFLKKPRRDDESEDSEEDSDDFEEDVEDDEESGGESDE